MPGHFHPGPQFTPHPPEVCRKSYSVESVEASSSLGPAGCHSYHGGLAYGNMVYGCLWVVLPYPSDSNSLWMIPSRNAMTIHIKESWNPTGSVSKPCTPVVHIKIAGKWMFIPLKMLLIGIDPYPTHLTQVVFRKAPCRCRFQKPFDHLSPLMCRDLVQPFLRSQTHCLLFVNLERQWGSARILGPSSLIKRWNQCFSKFVEVRIPSTTGRFWKSSIKNHRTCTWLSSDQKRDIPDWGNRANLERNCVEPRNWTACLTAQTEILQVRLHAPAAMCTKLSCNEITGSTAWCKLLINLSLVFTGTSSLI